MAKKNLQYENIETVQLTALQEQNVINILMLIKEINVEGVFIVREDIFTNLLKELRIVETQITLNSHGNKLLSEMFGGRFKNVELLSANILKSYICYISTIIGRALFPSDAELWKRINYTLIWTKKELQKKTKCSEKDLVYLERIKTTLEKIQVILEKIQVIQGVAEWIAFLKLDLDEMFTRFKADVLPMANLSVNATVEKQNFLNEPVYIYECKYFAISLSKRGIDEYKEWSRIHKERFEFLYSFTREHYTNLGLNLPDNVLGNIFNELLKNNFIDNTANLENFKFFMNGGDAFPRNFTPINWLKTKYFYLFMYCIKEFFYNGHNMKWDNLINLIQIKNKELTKKYISKRVSETHKKVSAFNRGEDILDKNEKSVYNLMKTVLNK